MRHIAFANTFLGLLVVLSVSRPALAQNTALPADIIHHLYEGDCAIVIDLPQSISPETVRIALNSPRSALAVSVIQNQPFVAALLEPLLKGSVAIVTLGHDNQEVRATVGARPADTSAPEGCRTSAAEHRPNLYDDRSTFEVNAFYGRALDNFAPGEILGINYVKPPVGDIDSRWTGGFQVATRLFGQSDDTQQLWVVSQTLHGNRSGELSCEQNPNSPQCPKTDTGRFFVALEHAETMEAHIDARYEFARLQSHSDMPIKVFVATRFGFLAMVGASRVYSSDAYFGGGFSSPKGAFRGSFAEVGWGRSRQFQSQPNANRLKISASLVFDVAPGLVGQARNIVSQAVSSTRAFVQIVVDRNPGGTAPDAVQTYFGVAFDVRRLVGAF